MTETPFYCEACRQWIPRPPARNLFGDVETERIVVGGICKACCAKGWDYDIHLQVVMREDQDEPGTTLKKTTTLVSK